MEKIAFEGFVKPYNRNGTKFGYPTANITIENRSISGIFVGYTELISSENEEINKVFHDKKLSSIIFVGVAETLNQQDRRLESHILDFPPIDLYGFKIKVTIVEKIRDNQKFESIEELIKKMKEDEQISRKWFNKNTNV